MTDGPFFSDSKDGKKEKAEESEELFSEEEELFSEEVEEDYSDEDVEYAEDEYEEYPEEEEEPLPELDTLPTLSESDPFYDLTEEDDRRTIPWLVIAIIAAVIGLGVAAIISVVAPLTQAGLNPARDFGPRLVAYFLGWGEIAIPGPRNGFFTVYIVAPIVGALIGGGIYRLIARRYPKE